MSRHSRGYTAAALLAALMALPAMAQAQASVAEKSLMNRIGWEPGVPAQPVATRGTGDESQASRALLGTVGAVRFEAREAGAADAGFPTAAQALLGQATRAKTRE